MTRVKSETSSSAFWKTFQERQKTVHFLYIPKDDQIFTGKDEKMYFIHTLLNNYDSLKKVVDITEKNQLFVTWNSVALKKKM